MKLKFNERKQGVDLEFEEQDFADALQIQEMVGGEFVCRKCGTNYVSKGWQILQGYFKSARELIIEAGKAGAHSRVKSQMSALKFAKLDGFDYAVGLPQRVVDQAELAKKAIAEQEDIRHEAGDGGY